MPARVLKVHPADNVIVALRDLSAGETIEFDQQTYTLPYAVSAKHKFVTEDRQTGDPITMYGVLVGKAMQPIRRGEPITTFNLKHSADRYGIDKRQPYDYQPPDVTKWQDRTFMGYHRTDGSVGTRNYWLVVPLVFCENRNVLILKDAFERELGYAQPETYREQVHELLSLYKAGDLDVIKKMAPFVDESQNRTLPHTTNDKRPFKNVDGIKFLTHEMGCGGTRQDSNALGALLAGFINNPNVAGATILSLGCQHLQADIIEQEIRRHNTKFDKPLLIFEQQAGTEYALMAQAVKETFLGLAEINKLERKPAPLSALTIGLKCGGSDGFSGISANPAVGHTSDLLVTLGGSVILAEFPELCGVEQEIVNRSVDHETAQRFTSLMKAYGDSAIAVGSGFDMNPSPGNIRDGLITDAIKSAGAARKGGSSPVVAVLDYPELVTKPGLNLLCTPGNDVESTTAEVGSGANVVLFTTGLGTPTGNPIAPVIKISTNTKLAQRMPDIIDLNTGTIIDGEETIEQAGERILDYVIQVASGLEVHAVRHGQTDFIPWKRGVSL